MPNYICQRCGYKTDRVSNYNRHCRRQNPCKPKKTEIICDDSGVHSNSIPNIPKYSQIPKNQESGILFLGVNKGNPKKIKKKSQKKPADFAISPSDFALTKKKSQKNQKNEKSHSETDMGGKKLLNFNNDSCTNESVNICDMGQNKFNNSVGSKQKQRFPCPHCKSDFSTTYNMNKHIRKYHPNAIKTQSSSDELSAPQPSQPQPLQTPAVYTDPAYVQSKIAELESEIQRLKSQPKTVIEQHNHNQNILQVVCVGNNDNYLDMLTDKWGDYDRALGFIRECALSEVNGDCKLIQQVYFTDRDEAPIRYLDRGRNKIEFIDENNETVVDPKGQKLGRRLANNLQNTYLKGVNYLINENLDNQGCPNKFLEDYDIQCWNHHIYELSNPHFYKKIISHLEIP